jgi:RNAse (barnase) inhibitor barstar
MTSNTNLTHFAYDNNRYVLLDGLLCDTMEKCYNTLSSQLRLPDYFGYNLDALDEVLTDLEWIDEDKIIIVVLHAKALLAAEEEMKPDFLNILINCENPRVQVVM